MRLFYIVFTVLLFPTPDGFLNAFSPLEWCYLVAHYTRLSSTLFADKGTLAAKMFEQRWYHEQQESYRARVTIKAVDSEGKYVKKRNFVFICREDKYWNCWPRDNESEEKVGDD